MAEQLEKKLAERKAEKKKEKPSQKPKMDKGAKAAPVDTKGITVKKQDDLSECKSCLVTYLFRVLILPQGTNRCCQREHSSPTTTSQAATS